MVSRRSVLVGLGGLVAGGGALIGTGAFTTVEAERTVSVETAGDADAFLGLAPVDRADNRGSETNSTAAGSGENEYVSDPGDGTIEIDLDGVDNDDADGLNQNAITTFRNLVQVTNNGTQTVTSVNLNMSEIPSEVNSASDTFDFTVDKDDTSDSVENNTDILTGTDDIPNELSPGESVSFGIVVNLIDGGNQDNDPPDLPDGGSYTLTITANTS
jgi:hypothetical protein